MSHLERRFSVRVEDLRRALNCRLSSRIDEFLRALSLRDLKLEEKEVAHLQEDLAKDAIGLLLENGAEDYCDSIDAGIDIDGFFRSVQVSRCLAVHVSGRNVPVMDRHELRRSSLSVGRRICLQLPLCLERPLERRRHRIPLNQRDIPDQFSSSFGIGG